MARFLAGGGGVVALSALWFALFPGFVLCKCVQNRCFRGILARRVGRRVSNEGQSSAQAVPGRHSVFSFEGADLETGPRDVGSECGAACVDGLFVRRTRQLGARLFLFLFLFPFFLIELLVLVARVQTGGSPANLKKTATGVAVNTAGGTAQDGRRRCRLEGRGQRGGTGMTDGRTDGDGCVKQKRQGYC